MYDFRSISGRPLYYTHCSLRVPTVGRLKLTYAREQCPVLQVNSYIKPVHGQGKQIPHNSKENEEPPKGVYRVPQATKQHTAEPPRDGQMGRGGFMGYIEKGFHEGAWITEILYTVGIPCMHGNQNR